MPDENNHNAEKQRYLECMAADLINTAERMGFVVRIDTVPDIDRPLAMGNIRMVPIIRPRRGNY